MDTYGPLRQSWPIRLEENNNTFVHSNKVSCGPISSVQKKTTTTRKNDKLLKAQQTFFKKAKCFNRQCFLFKTLHIKPRRQLCSTQAVILSSTSNFTSEPQVKNVLSLHVMFLFFGCAIHSNGPLRKHRLSSVGSKVMSVGCDWLILIHVVYFDYD